MTQFPSELLENAVTEIGRLPGIGRKTALRLALYLLRKDPAEANNLGRAIIDLRNNIRYCRVCHNICESDTCRICSSASRDSSLVCVVENVQDVMSIESTGQYNGLYHVLGGLISPVDGISPDMLTIDSLVSRVASGEVTEIILALSATIEGDTTNYYIARRLADWPQVKLSRLARGMSVGNEIEYTDEVTLGRSLIERVPYNS